MCRHWYPVVVALRKFQELTFLPGQYAVKDAQHHYLSSAPATKVLLEVLLLRELEETLRHGVGRVLAEGDMEVVMVRFFQLPLSFDGMLCSSAELLASLA